MNPKAQSHIQNLLDTSIREGRDRGLQFTAYLNGELIVDVVSGVADVRSGSLVEKETLFPIFSVSKGITATIIHLLAERGRFHYDQPIADFWPEFGCNGKEKITLRHALNHTAGLQNVPLDIGRNDILDWKKVCSTFAESFPVSTPGSKTFYHAVTFGWILGELACRVEEKTFSQILHDEIKTPLGIEAMYMGIPDEVEERVAHLEDPTARAPSQDTPVASPVPVWMLPLHDCMNQGDFRRCCLPGSSGIMNAHAIAQHYAALLPHGAQGKKLLSPERVTIATDPSIGVFEEHNPSSNLWTLGYILNDGPSAMKEKKRSSFGHGGFGGSNGFADPESGLAIGLTKNLFGKNGVGFELLNELKIVLGIH